MRTLFVPFTLGLAALTLVTPATAQVVAPPAAAYAPVVLSVADARADVALMRRALETIHPGLYRYQTKSTINAAFARLERATGQPIETLALHREIALMLATIHCDHTKAELPVRLADYRRTHPTHLPLRFRLIEGRMIVTANDGQPGAPSVGAEIHGPVLKVLDSERLCVALGATPDQWIEVRLAQRKTGYISAFGIATLYADMGDKDQAFQWLNTAYAEHDWELVRLRSDFLLDPLRSDPRFAELVRKVGLP